MFCRATQQSFLRLLTTAAVTRAHGTPPLTNEEAWNLSEEFLRDPRIGFAEEPASIEERWKQYAARDSATPKLWMDAYLAAFAKEAGCTLITGDRGFRQFEGLDVILLA